MSDINEIANMYDYIESISTSIDTIKIYVVIFSTASMDSIFYYFLQACGTSWYK